MTFLQWIRGLPVELQKEPAGDPTWFRSEIPPQPRHPRLTALLEQNRARQRVKRKRAARRLLQEQGLGGVL